MEKISVIIPTFNRSDKIEKSVRSVLDQTYPHLEIIIIDDGSKDDTEEVVKSINDERIRYIKNKQNEGASMARNMGVEYASASLIAFQDSDDVWRKDKLQKQMEYWKRNPEYALVYHSYLLHRLNHEAVSVPYAGTEGNLEGEIFSTLLQNNTIGTPTILMTKDSFLDCKGFDTSLDCLEDWDFVLRYSQKYAIGYCNETLLDAYQLEGGISSNPGAFYNCMCKMIARYKDELIKYKLFDTVIMRLFQKAENEGILDLVKEILFISLAN